MRKVLLSTLLAACCGPAMALEAPQVAVRWTLAFGDGSGLHPGYALAVDYADGGRAGPEVFALDVTDMTAIARLGGLPLMHRGYRADQNDLGAPEAAGANQPWYTRRWALWTAGGLAATVALAGAGGQEICTGTCNTSNTGGPAGNDLGIEGGPDGTGVTGVSVSNDEDGNPTVAAGCVNGQCVVCPNGDVQSSCEGDGFIGLDRRALGRVDVERQRWLDAGTGHMGDLAER